MLTWDVGLVNRTVISWQEVFCMFSVHLYKLSLDTPLWVFFNSPKTCSQDKTVIVVCVCRKY